MLPARFLFLLALVPVASYDPQKWFPLSPKRVPVTPRTLRSIIAVHDMCLQGVMMLSESQEAFLRICSSSRPHLRSVPPALRKIAKVLP